MAHNSYTWHIQAIVKKDAILPDALKARWDALTAGEAQNKVELANGDIFIKDWLMGKEDFQELRDVVHAEDAGTVEIKSATEMRSLLPVSIDAG
tara:strand:+ start:85 stop:366 length:282 start_codon:yes stop_codon:yes gene_type:complete